MIDVALICSTFPARNNLLYRSLKTWLDSINYSGLNGNIFVYSQCEPEIPILNTDPRVCYHMVDKMQGSHITGYNYWLARVQAKVYIFTHPDLLFPRETVRTAYLEATDNIAALFKVFWMPQEMTENIYNYPWYKPELLEDEMALYPLFDDGHGSFYWNKDVRSRTEWHSTTTWAVNNFTLDKLAPFEDFHEQGADDAWFFGMRSRLMIEDKCIMNPILFHQWHPQTWNGDSARAVELATQALNRRFK